MARFSLRSLGLAAAAPVGAVIIAAAISSIVLMITGHSPVDAAIGMWSGLGKTRIQISAINNAGAYYLAAVAVAIGFKMNLLNIGVEGQYTLAAMIAAAFAGARWLGDVPGVLRVVLTFLVAILVGAAWAGIAVVLKVTRGVSEVISTIMLNSIAGALIAYLMVPGRMAILDGNLKHTVDIPNDGLVGAISISGSTTPLYTLTLVAVVVGIAYALLLNRTVFGFSLRATGLNPAAAIASGIGAKKMAITAMLISGGVAGLVGMAELLNGGAHHYSQEFPTGYGIMGIAIALLGRNSPIGMALAALLWSFLGGVSNSLQSKHIPKELVTIMQGLIVLCVVIAYEVVRRYKIRLEQREVARALSDSPGSDLAEAGVTA
ncbi:MAG TPA: ABC transporter permease [Jatrophihabitans sp.]|jgi:simple sugar transport system permease protein